MKSYEKNIKLCAVGDISFTGMKYSIENAEKLFKHISENWANADIAVGNLESPFVEGKEKGVKNKCVLKSDPDWCNALSDRKIDVLSLANNHLMDFGAEGLLTTINVLNHVNIPYLGAGMNLKEALRPLLIERKKKTVAFLARSSVIVSSQCYATDTSPGVAWFDEAQTIQAIKKCKEKADFVVLLMHWGIEHYSYPTCEQRNMSKRLISAGLDLLIGHHPHVLQGFEKIEKGMVFYSLGNFVFEDVKWFATSEDGQQSEKIIKLKKANRETGMLEGLFSKRGFQFDRFIPYFIHTSGKLLPGKPKKEKVLKRLSGKFKWPFYDKLWRGYSIYKEFELRIWPLFKGKLRFQKIKKIRLHHFRTLIWKLRKSSQITSGKSTNPYD